MILATSQHAMRLNSRPPAPAPTPAAVIDEAIMSLDWAHEAAGTAIGDPGYAELEVLESAARDAARAAALLGGIEPAATALDVVAATRAAGEAASAFEAAASARRDEAAPGDADELIMQQGEVAEAALHRAFQALGTDRD